MFFFSLGGFFYCQPCHKAAVATPHKAAAVGTATPRHQLSEREQIVILEAKLAQRDQEVKVRSSVADPDPGTGARSGNRCRIREPVPEQGTGAGSGNRCRILEPVPDPGTGVGSGNRCRFDPGIRDGKKLSGSGSRMNKPDHISQSLKQFFGG